MDAHLKDDSPYSQLLGIEPLRVDASGAVMRLVVTPALANRNGVMHGGAIMSLADHCAGSATYAHLPPGKTTTTTESKTNFLRPVRVGDTVEARSEPIHLGRTMLLWKTDIVRGDGKLAAVVLQTQLIMEWSEPPKTKA